MDFIDKFLFLSFNDGNRTCKFWWKRVWSIGGLARRIKMLIKGVVIVKWFKKAFLAIKGLLCSFTFFLYVSCFAMEWKMLCPSVFNTAMWVTCFEVKWKRNGREIILECYTQIFQKAVRASVGCMVLQSRESKCGGCGTHEIEKFFEYKVHIVC